MCDQFAAYDESIDSFDDTSSKETIKMKEREFHQNLLKQVDFERLDILCVHYTVALCSDIAHFKIGAVCNWNVAYFFCLTV